MLRLITIICIGILAFNMAVFAQEQTKGKPDVITMLDEKVTVEFIPAQDEKPSRVVFTFSQPGIYGIRISGAGEDTRTNKLYRVNFTIEKGQILAYETKPGTPAHLEQKNDETKLTFEDFNRFVTFDVSREYKYYRKFEIRSFPKKKEGEET